MKQLAKNNINNRSISILFPARRKTQYGSRPLSNQCGRRITIRTKQLSDANTASVSAQDQLTLAKHKQNVRKQYGGIPAGKVAIYVASFVTFVGVIAIGYEHPNTSAEQAQPLSFAATVNTGENSKAPSVDDIVATDVAASIAERANLPIAPTVANTSVSLNAQNELAQSDDGSVLKPQMIAQSESSREIVTYKTKRGDTVQSIAKKFNVSESTISWVNNLDSDALSPGKKLKILPIDGITYTVKKGDSVKEIASRYGTNETRIVSYNDLELSKPKVGQKLIIPNGVLPRNERPGYEAPIAQSQQQNGDSLGGGVINRNLSASIGNRYAPGNCTWYAYERRAELGRPVGSFWGNANTWAYNARAAGYKVNNKPAAGAVLAEGGGYYGHVGVVESVKSNGDIVISEMNNYAYGGFNIVNHRTISKGQAASYQYIH